LRLLALDHGTRTGWAIGCGDRLPAIGSRKNPHGGGRAELEPFWEAHAQWLRGLFTDFRPTLVVWERPVLAKFTSHASVEITFGLQAVTGLCAREAGLPVRVVSPQQAKIALTGHGRATKEEMVESALTFGFTRIDHHDEADAFAVWLHTLRLLEPNKAVRFQPGFRLRG
jgi:Holliday junction resolvasome RuvABC endonuclease subunit